MSNRKKTDAAAEVKEEVKATEVAEEVTETKPETAEVSKPEEDSKKEASPKMYVGPTVVDFAIQNGVYTEIPDAAKKKVEEMPELGNLFIEIRDYPKANKMLRERTGYIYSAYMKALALKNGGK